MRWERGCAPHKAPDFHQAGRTSAGQPIPGQPGVGVRTEMSDVAMVLPRERPEEERARAPCQYSRPMEGRDPNYHKPAVLQSSRTVEGMVGVGIGVGGDEMVGWVLGTAISTPHLRAVRDRDMVCGWKVEVLVGNRGWLAPVGGVARMLTRKVDIVDGMDRSQFWAKSNALS
ncbi:hypothetical protein Tco_1262872 [Tanacetum coccineum]